MLPGWSRTDSPTSVGGAEGVPHSIVVLVCCRSQRALLCVRVRQCVLKCACLSCTASCMKECMQVLAHRVMWEYKWSLYFQKQSIVLGINEKLDRPVFVCTAYPVNTPGLVAGVCFLR